MVMRIDRPSRKQRIEIPAYWLDAAVRSLDSDELRLVLTIIRIGNWTSSNAIETDVAQICQDANLREALQERECDRPFDQIIEGLISKQILSRAPAGTLLRLQFVHPPDHDDTAKKESSAASFETGSQHSPWAFQLYEQNFGSLTPTIADQIRVAVETYPEVWIRDAIRDAVTYNRRSWRYVQRILANWAESEHKTQTEKTPANETRRRGAEGAIDTRRYRQGGYLKRARKLPM